MRAWIRTPIALAFACTLALLPACGDDDGNGGGGGGDPTGVDVPQDWWGTWENTVETTPCGTEIVLRETTVDTVQICPDALGVFDDPDFETFRDRCTETIDGNTYRIVCEGTEVVFGACEVAFDADLTATFAPDGESYTFSGRYETVPTAGCAGVIDATCETVSGTAVRLSTSIEGCDDGGDGGGPTSMTLVVTGGAAAGTTDFAANEVTLGVEPEGEGWAVFATDIANSFTNFRTVTIVVPPDVTEGQNWTVATAAETSDIILQYTDIREQTAWDLTNFDGRATITTRTVEQLEGTLSGGGTLTSGDGDATEEVSIDIDFDARTTVTARASAATWVRGALQHMLRTEAARRF